MYFVDNKDGLIGDFLGSMPAVQKLATKEHVLMKIHPEAKKLTPLYGYQPNISFTGHELTHVDHTIHSATAFNIAIENDYYMTQAFMKQVGLPVSDRIPYADIHYEKYSKGPTCDYIISPFARSLPPEQKWPKEKWQELVDTLSGHLFILIGTKVHDDPNFITGPNVITEFDGSFEFVCTLMKDSNAKALISVVTGTSHLAFHLNVKNILLNNQNFKWGTNPDAIQIRDNIHDITVEQVIKKLKEHAD